MLVRMHPLKLYILFLFQVLWDLPSLWLYSMCVCLWICVHTHVQQSLLSTVFFHTMTAHSNPIKATQRASQHHSFVCHSFSPPSLSLFLLLPVDDWVVTGWVRSNYHFFFLSLCLFLLHFLS